MAQSPDVLLQQMAKSLEEIAKNSSEERKLRLLPQGDRAGATAAQRSSGSPFSLGGLKDAVGGIRGMDKVGAVMGAAGGALTAFAGAAGAAVSSISQLTGAVSNFVSAISPSIVQALGRAMHDLNAAIGQAFTGAMEEAVGYVRELGSIINPLAQELQPIIRQFAEIMRSLAVPYIELYATVLRAMMPAFQLFADLLQAVVPVLQAYMVILAAVIQTLGEWVGSLFDNGMRSAVKSLQDALMNLAKFIVLAFARIAQFFGATDMLKNLEEQLRGGKRADNTGLGVGSNPQQQDFMSAARQSMLASLLAGNRDDKKQTEEQWREQIADVLKQVRDGQSDAIAKALEAAKEKIAEAIAEGVQKAFTESGVGRFIASVNGAVSPQSTVGAVATAGLGPMGIPIRFANSLFGR